MTPERIAELLSPFIPASLLSSKQIRSIQAYLDLLLKWNAKMNLTAIRDPDEIMTRHFGESFFAAHQLFPSGNSDNTATDIGSGAGFPGLPMKLCAESLNLTLIESNHRKATFLREVVRILYLESVTVVSERAEQVSGQADVVTLRAVESFERILPTVRSLTRLGGRTALLIGSSQVEAAKSILPKAQWQTPRPVPNSRSRVLLIGNL